jgi:hypothetical protein
VCSSNCLRRHDVRTKFNDDRFRRLSNLTVLIIGVCMLLSEILTVNYNTFCFATIDKVFYLVASVLTTCFGP